MTQQEFTERTGYVPNSQIEFWLIHEDYMRSDYDKDEFCKRWKLTNKFLRRVAIAEMDCVKQRNGLERQNLQSSRKYLNTLLTK